MNSLIITSCTNRKTIAASDELCARNLAAGNMDTVVAAWAPKVKCAAKVRIARDMYCGRAFIEAKTSQLTLGAEMWIISAGLGLIKSDSMIASYNLTASKSVKDCISNIAEDFSPNEWWSKLLSAFGQVSVNESLTNNNFDRIFAALPEGYLKLIEADLLKLSDRHLKKIRIFGPRNIEKFEERLQKQIMPYDDRLEGPNSPLPGTRIDFAQRALRHFVEQISDRIDQSTEEDYANVLRALEPLKQPRKIKRTSKSDKEICELILGFWEKSDGKSGKALRILRDECQIACEQGRFAALFRSVKRGKDNEI